MSQQQKSPAVMMRIQEVIEDRLRGLNLTTQVRILLKQGWIDIDWAADHTRPLGALLSAGNEPEFLRGEPAGFEPGGQP